MKKIIALLLIALVVLTSGCTLGTTNQGGGTGESGNPMSQAFGSAGSENVGSPPAMPELPG